MPTLDVNTNAVIELTAKLEKLHKSAFPSAVRNTLNRAAFETMKEIPNQASKTFTTRQKTFFKRMSIVERANGFNVKTMASMVGIDASKDQRLADNLAAQETGGTVNGRKITPHDDARTSRSFKKPVSRKNYVTKVKAHDATRAFKSHKGSRKTKFIAAVMSTAMSGKGHMMLMTGNRGLIYEVKSVRQNIKNRKVQFKIKKLYNVRKTDKHTVQSNQFIKKSVFLSTKQIPEYYKESAEFQFKKHIK
jgi:hypothetical protein